MRKALTWILVITLVAAAGLAAWWRVDQSNNTPLEPATSQQTEPESTEPEATERVETIQYQGEDGRTALELLEEAADVKTSGSGDMVFVTAINDVEADPNTEFWEFRVNGQQARVGAAQYETKSSDTITWKLTKIDTSLNEGSIE